MLPVDAWWNSAATMQGEVRSHEAGHVAAAHLLGFEVVEIFMDAKHGDWGKLGEVHSRWTGPIDDVEELAFRRATVAAAGPIVSDSWERDRSREDRATVEAVRFPVWSRDGWMYMVIDKTRRLRRTEAFRQCHYRVTKALAELGDFGTLAGDELRAVLTSDPDAEPPSNGFAANPSVAISARRPSSITHDAVKIADAAPGVPRSSLPPAGVPHHAEVPA